MTIYCKNCGKQMLRITNMIHWTDDDNTIHQKFWCRKCDESFYVIFKPTEIKQTFKPFQIERFEP